MGYLRGDDDSWYDDETAEPTVTAKPLVLNVPAKKQVDIELWNEQVSPSSMVVPLLLGLGALLIFTGTLKL